MAITITSDSATIGGSQHFLASDSTSITYQTSDCVLQVMLDLSTLQAGDTFRVRIYDKVNGADTVLLDQSFTDAQTVGFASECYVVGEGWECSVVKSAGTDRDIGWSLRQVS